MLKFFIAKKEEMCCYCNWDSKVNYLHPIITLFLPINTIGFGSSHRHYHMPGSSAPSFTEKPYRMRNALRREESKFCLNGQKTKVRLRPSLRERRCINVTIDISKLPTAEQTDQQIAQLQRERQELDSSRKLRAQNDAEFAARLASRKRGPRDEIFDIEIEKMLRLREKHEEQVNKCCTSYRLTNNVTRLVLKCAERPATTKPVVEMQLDAYSARNG